MRQLLLTADTNNAVDVVSLARSAGLGVELMAFAYPDILDGDWERERGGYLALLEGLPGPLSLHGPFIDMVSGSADKRIQALTRERYEHTIAIAASLGARRVVFHANYIASLRNDFYRKSWHAANLAFWPSLGDAAQAQGIVLALENMWEYDPHIIGDLLGELDHPAVRACLDVGHAHLFGDAEFSLDAWFAVMNPWLETLHTNNNNGVVDEHYGFDWPDGALDYAELVPQMQALPTGPDITLEMWHVADMRRSLRYFGIEA
jgi:sugar phosphate isomerase/epimerase